MGYYYPYLENANTKCDDQKDEHQVVVDIIMYDDYAMSLTAEERENDHNNSLICFRGHKTATSNSISRIGDESDIICCGHESCEYESITVSGYGSNIFRLGYLECYGCSLISGKQDNSNTLYYGVNSCAEADIRNVE